MPVIIIHRLEKLESERDLKINLTMGWIGPSRDFVLHNNADTKFKSGEVLINAKKDRFVVIIAKLYETIHSMWS